MAEYRYKYEMPEVGHLAGQTFEFGSRWDSQGNYWDFLPFMRPREVNRKIAQDAALDVFNHRGWDSCWPHKLKIWTVGNKSELIGTFTVDCKVDPRFKVTHG